jgi:hypothetical protein
MFGRRAANGRYKDLSAFIGLLEAIVAVEDRTYRGKKLTNMNYNADFHTICTNLVLISPCAYNLFRDVFAGPHTRSLMYVSYSASQYYTN